MPGLEFRNQRVEAAYRKELVYGEDDAARAQPPTVAELFANVRRNYFRLYFHYVYFNVFRYLYLQPNNIFADLLLVPTIIAGKITLGLMNQISYAFGQVTSLVPVSGQLVVDDRGADVGLQASAGLRSGAPRRAAARDRPALSRARAGRALPPEDQPAA